jgi:hypothetical protein
MGCVKNSMILWVLLLTSKVMGQNYNSGLHHVVSLFTYAECGDRARYQLRGAVKSLDTKEFYKPVPKEKIDSIVKAHLNSPGPFSHEKKYFDTLGREIKSLRISGTKGIEFIYDSLGHLSKVGILKREFNQNTGKGRYGEFFANNFSASLNWITKGNQVIGTAVSAMQTDSVIYTVDDRKNIIRIESYFDRKKQPVYHYVYDSLNRIISSRNFNPNAVEIYNWTYFYNEQGFIQNWVKKDPNGKIIETHFFKYDAYGNLLHIEGEGPGNSFQNDYEYVYDEKGNWILCSTIQKGKVTNLRFREIHYFEK